MARVFNCAVIGDVLAEPDTVIKAIVTKKAVASRTSFTGTQEEIEAAKVSIKKEIAAMVTSGSYPTITSSVVAAGGAEVTIQFTLVQDPEMLLNIAPPPNLVLLCYTPVAQTTLKSLEMLWVPTLTQMFARPQVVLAATRVETLAHQKIMDRVGTKPVTCETIIDKASSWRAVDYVEVSAACNIHLNTLLNALGMACLHIPAQRMTTEQAKEQRRECMKPILSTQSVWTFKRHPVTGRVFYGNRITEQSQWTRPEDYDGEEPELTAAEKEAEEQAKRLLEEQRIREQHEKQLEEQTRQEVAVHNERVHELEKKSALLTRDVAELQIRVGEIRDIIQRNRREREDLERQQDQITEARFAKSTVDDDLKIERDINDAKIKLFMLEGRVALSDDMGVQTTEIAEAILVNNSLAQQLRELIAEQLKVRKQGSASQTRIDTLTKQHEDAIALVSSLATKAPTVKNNLMAAEDELRQAERSRLGMQEEMKRLSNALHVTDHGAYERQQHVTRLQREIAELDVKIDAQRVLKGSRLSNNRGQRASSPTSAAYNKRFGGGSVGSTDANENSQSGSMMTHPLQAEEARAHLEQEGLIEQLTGIACECAQFEIASRQKLELLKYLVSEFNYAAGKRVEVIQQYADGCAKRRDEKLLGLSYPVSNPHELRQLQFSIDDRITELAMTRNRFSKNAEAAAAAGLNATPSHNNTSRGGPTNGRQRANSASASTPQRGAAATGGNRATTASNRTPNRFGTTPSSATRTPIGGGGSSTARGIKDSVNGTTPKRSGTNDPSNLSNTTGAGQPSYIANQQQSAQTRLQAIAELRQVKALLQQEQSAEEAAEHLAATCRIAEQRVKAAKLKATQQQADLRDALQEAMREIATIERLQGYESSSPLERLVALVDDVVSASAQALLAAKAGGAVNTNNSDNPNMRSLTLTTADINLGSQLVSQVANAFTEKMLNAVPAQERAAVAHELNHAASRDLQHNGPAPSAQAIVDAINGTLASAQHAHHTFVDTAAKRGIAAAAGTVAAEASTLSGPSARHLHEKARLLEARSNEGRAQYTRHADRVKGALGMMQPITAVQRDDQMRAQNRFYKR